MCNAILFKHCRYARVVELADSLDSGSSVHYARAGSSPASRTKKYRIPNRVSCTFLFPKRRDLNPRAPGSYVSLKNHELRKLGSESICGTAVCHYMDEARTVQRHNGFKAFSVHGHSVLINGDPEIVF